MTNNIKVYKLANLGYICQGEFRKDLNEMKELMRTTLQNQRLVFEIEDLPSNVENYWVDTLKLK